MSYKMKIEFCMMWNFAPKAAGLAEELFSHFRHEIENLELVPSTGGAFEVTVNGEKVFSKLDVGRFPTGTEIIEAMTR